VFLTIKTANYRLNPRKAEATLKNWNGWE